MSKRFEQDISISVNGVCKQVLKIGHSPRDGGFWIQDRIRPKAQKVTSHVFKIKWNQNNHGQRIAKPTYQAFTLGDLKLSHHADGNAQISGNGVLSGYENGVPKGAAVKSFALTDTNDGGAVVTFSVWGIDQLPRDARERDIVLSPDPNRLHPGQNKTPNAVAIEGFYIPRHLLPKPPYSQDTVNYHSDIAGNVTLRIVNLPQNTPGVLGFCASYVTSSNGSDFGFFLSGAPGQVIDGFNEGLTIMYPSNDNTNLDQDLNWPQ